jgi:manganese transport protein
MYRSILVALENSNADASLIEHIEELARVTRSHLLLVHVADGWAARNFESLTLAESEEMRADRQYLEDTAARLRKAGLEVSVQLALGDPPTEILKTADREHVELIAMSAHGHRLIGDLVYGSTIHEVRHRTHIPVLIVRAGERPKKE